MTPEGVTSPQTSIMMLESKAFRVWFGAALLTGAIFSGEALSAQDKQTSVSSASGQKADPEATRDNSTVSVTLDEEYRIGPQDVLQIDVWKEPEITRMIPVRPDGKISLPLLNDLQAAGLTAMELASSIRERLTKYRANPQVTVTVTSIGRSHQVPPQYMTPPYKVAPPGISPELKQKCCVA